MVDKVTYIILLLAVFPVQFVPGTAVALDASVEVESGALWQTRNDVAIPGDSGTEFSLLEIIDTPVWVNRLYVSIFPKHRHEVRILVAPLRLEGSGTLEKRVDFAGHTFNSTDPTKALFRFDSYRITYRYELKQHERYVLKIGATGKIRSAEITLTQGTVTGTKDDLGFVPLLNACVLYKIKGPWVAVADADFLAAPQGRAEDVSLKVGYGKEKSPWSYAAGYRTLEGGADNDSVYTFSWFHYAIFSISYSF